MNPINQPSALGGVASADPSKRAFAEQRLHEYIQHGVPIAQSVINRVLSEVPQDQVAPAKVLDFEPNENGIHVQVADRDPRRLHRNAIGQMAGRAGIPLAYVDRLADGDEPWRRDLLAHTLREHFHHDDHRYLIRSIGNETRGFLSDRYRRIDCRPVLETLVNAATKAGALVVQGTASDVRASLKIILPEIFEPVPGEFIVWGLSWTNSNFGKGANELQIFGNRLVCWNGMVAEKAIRQIHLGRRLDDDIAYSDRTLRLDTEAAVSAVEDVAGHYLSHDKVAGYLDSVAKANAAEVNGKAAAASLAKRTTKATAAQVVDAFNSADVVDLPPGNTEWRWSNAISLVARDEADPDKKIDLERLAGEVLSRHGLN